MKKISLAMALWCLGSQAGFASELSRSQTAPIAMKVYTFEQLRGIGLNHPVLGDFPPRAETAGGSTEAKLHVLAAATDLLSLGPIVIARKGDLVAVAPTVQGQALLATVTATPSFREDAGKPADKRFDHAGVSSEFARMLSRQVSRGHTEDAWRSIMGVFDGSPLAIEAVLPFEKTPRFSLRNFVKASLGQHALVFHEEHGAGYVGLNKDGSLHYGQNSINEVREDRVDESKIAVELPFSPFLGFRNGMPLELDGRKYKAYAGYEDGSLLVEWQEAGHLKSRRISYQDAVRGVLALSPRKLNPGQAVDIKAADDTASDATFLSYSGLFARVRYTHQIQRPFGETPEFEWVKTEGYIPISQIKPATR